MLDVDKLDEQRFGHVMRIGTKYFVQHDIVKEGALPLDMRLFDADYLNKRLPMTFVSFDCEFHLPEYESHVELLDFIRDNPYKVKVDCALGLSIALLQIIREMYGDDIVNAMPFYHRQLWCSMATQKCFLLPPCELEEQKTLLDVMPYPAFAWIGGYVAHQVATDETTDDRLQGENSIYLGDQKFLVYVRDNTDKDTVSASFQIRTFDEVVEGLKKSNCINDNEYTMYHPVSERKTCRGNEIIGIYCLFEIKA